MSTIIYRSGAPQLLGSRNINYGTYTVEEQPSEGTGVVNTTITLADITYVNTTTTSGVNNCKLTFKIAANVSCGIFVGEPDSDSHVLALSWMRPLGASG